MDRQTPKRGAGDMLNLLWPWALVLLPLPYIYRRLRSVADTNIRALRAPLLASVARGTNPSASAAN